MKSKKQKLATGRFSREVAAGYDRKVIDGSRIVLVGCGALGQFIALVLALIGYGDVIFVDMDTFEESNISRSPFYCTGSNKAEATATGARALCTSLGTVTYRYFDSMVQWLGDSLFNGTRPTIVLVAVDSELARYWLAQRCRVMGVPLIEGGFRGERWNLSIFPNTHEDEPCWCCDQREIHTGRIFSCQTYARAAEKAGLIPATAPGAMALAAWQADMATAFLHGDETLHHCTLFTDLRTGRMQIMKRVKNPACLLDHQIASRDSVPLTSGPADRVGGLLDELGSLVSEPVVELPASFARVAPCVKCRKPALVEQPEWAIQALVCQNCGGPFRRRPDLILEQHGILSFQTSKCILDVPLHQLGLGPGLHLHVRGRDRQITVRLSGNAENVLKHVAGVEPAREKRLV